MHVKMYSPDDTEFWVFEARHKRSDSVFIGVAHDVDMAMLLHSRMLPPISLFQLVLQQEGKEAFELTKLAGPFRREVQAEAERDKRLAQLEDTDTTVLNGIRAVSP